MREKSAYHLNLLISYPTVFTLGEDFFFSFMPANAEVGGKQGSRVGRRGGRKEDKENVKSVLIQLVWGKYYPS